MMTPDDIAQEAARIAFREDRVSIAEAIHLARVHLKAPGTIASPKHGRVREHLRGLSMQALGEPAYHDFVQGMFETAELVMTLFDEADPVLAGRAALGQLDGGVTLHIRVYTSDPIGVVAERLVEAGYDEPSFETVNTRFGRLNRVRFESGGWPIVLTRCRPDMRSSGTINLFRDERIATLDLTALRHRISNA